MKSVWFEIDDAGDKGARAIERTVVRFGAVFYPADTQARRILLVQSLDRENLTVDGLTARSKAHRALGVGASVLQKETAANPLSRNS